MPRDVSLDGEFTTKTNFRNDFTTVSGDEYRVQRAAILIQSINVPWKGEHITRERAEDFRGTVENTLQRDPELDVEAAARLTDVRGSELEVTVDIGDEQLAIQGP